MFIRIYHILQAIEIIQDSVEKECTAKNTETILDKSADIDKSLKKRDFEKEQPVLDKSLYVEKHIESSKNEIRYKISQWHIYLLLLN